MLKEVCPKDVAEVYETSIVQQTAFWSEVKRNMGVESMAFNFKFRKDDFLKVDSASDTEVSDILVVNQRLDNNHSIAYVPYGPELEPVDGAEGVFIEELSECLRSYLPSDTIMIRYDLSWESFWARDPDYFHEDGVWAGPPDVPMQELRFNFDTINWNIKKAHTNFLPAHTIFLDITKSEDEIMASMKPKTRYNIGLAQRKGVTVRELGMTDLDVWYELYRETTIRNGLFLHPRDYFEAVLLARANNTASPAQVKLLLAEAEGMPLSAMFLVLSGKRATYLYGASASMNKNYMASYALQMEAILIAKAHGCREYDLFGVSPGPDESHPMYGLYRFKTGFGGKIFHSLGSWDYPFDEKVYSFYTAHEMTAAGYHIR